MANSSTDTQKVKDDNNSHCDDSNQETKPTSSPIIDGSAFGYDLFPERSGERYKPSWSGILWGGEGREHHARVKCEHNVYSCVKNSPIIKLFFGALKASGCEIDIRRHIACEVCDESVSGGYDPALNQIVICQNVANKEGYVQATLMHELIHMFDYCENKLDFKNLDHLACTEVRAANLAHCSFLSACVQGDASLVNIRKMHQECVKTKAMSSVISARNVSPKEAVAAVERVFSKCYDDLEPVGRRLRRNSADMHKAFLEGEYYGYTT